MLDQAFTMDVMLASEMGPQSNDDLPLQDSAEGMRHIRGQLSQSRVISSAWDPTGWHGVRRGRNETSIPLNRRMHARLRQ